MAGMRFATQCLSGFNKIINTSLTSSEIGAVVLIYTIRYPVYDHYFGPVVPEFTVNFVTLGVYYIQALCRRWLMHFYFYGG